MPASVTNGDPLTAAQLYRFDELVRALATDTALIRWAIKAPPSRATDLTVAMVRLRLVIQNFGDSLATIRLQGSDSNVSDNARFNYVYPPVGTFEGTFTDIAGTSLSIKPRTIQEFEITVPNTYVQVYGRGPCQLRIQGDCSAQIDLIGVNTPNVLL